MSKISQYPRLPALTGTEILLGDTGAPGSQSTVGIPVGLVNTVTAENAFRYGVNPLGGDISAALQVALNSTPYVWLPPTTNGSIYILHDVTIPSAGVLFAPGVQVQDTAGSQFVLKCVGAAPTIIGLIIVSAPNSPVSIIFNDSTDGRLVDTFVDNAQTAIQVMSGSNGANGVGCINTQILNVVSNTFTGVGLQIQPNTSYTQCSNLILNSGGIAGTGGQIPRTGAIGVQITGTGSIVTAGRHQFINTIVKNAQTGFLLTDTSDNMLSGIEVSSASGYACQIAGSGVNNTVNIITGINTAGVINATGTSTRNKVRGASGTGTGVIPSGGGSNWYSSAGFSAPFVDASTSSSAAIAFDCDSWMSSGANSYGWSETLGTSLQLIGGVLINLNSLNTIASNTTTYLTPSGNTATEVAANFNLPFGVIAYAARFTCIADTAPGAGQTFTYNLRNNGVNTTLSGVTSGASATKATVTGAPAAMPPSTPFTVQVITSAGAAAAHHYVSLQFVEPYA